MTAEEARKLNEEYIKKLHIGDPDLDKQIAAAASKGKKSLYIDLSKTEYNLRDQTFETIKTVYSVPPRSFFVKREKSSSDCRGEGGSDGITISW